MLWMAGTAANNGSKSAIQSIRCLRMVHPRG
jgi:hypothetical protein